MIDFGFASLDPGINDSDGGTPKRFLSESLDCLGPGKADLVAAHLCASEMMRGRISPPGAANEVSTRTANSSLAKTLMGPEHRGR